MPQEQPSDVAAHDQGWLNTQQPTPQPVTTKQPRPSEVSSFLFTAPTASTPKATSLGATSHLVRSHNLSMINSRMTDTAETVTATCSQDLFPSIEARATVTNAHTQVNCEMATTHTQTETATTAKTQAASCQTQM